MSIEVGKSSEPLDQQSIVQRSRMFTFLPLGVACLFGANLVFDLVSVNLSEHARRGLPWRLALLPIDTSATLLIAILGAVLARAQYAQAQRPTLGYSLDFRQTGLEKVGPQWRMHVYNGGPGMATVVSTSYLIQFREANGPASADVPGWVDVKAAVAILQVHELTIESDFFLRWLGAGAPLVPVNRSSDGSMIARLSNVSISRLRRFDIRIVVRDSVGDTHQRTFMFIDRLPSHALVGGNVDTAAVPVQSNSDTETVPSD